MCGLAGVIVGRKRRSGDELQTIKGLFTRLLVESEHRGPYATGVAVVNRDGGYRVAKEPLVASEFVEAPEYRRLMGSVGRNTSMIMGHTRWPTRGSHLDNRNNHPLISDRPVALDRNETAAILLTHNGHIANADALFRSTGLRRDARVDSEILLRMAERNLGGDGIDIGGLERDLSLCRGRLSVVILSTNKPEQILLVKGNMPLCVWHHPGLRLMAYASEAGVLGMATGGIGGWRALEIPIWTILVVDTGGPAPSSWHPLLGLPDSEHCEAYKMPPCEPRGGVR